MLTPRQVECCLCFRERALRCAASQDELHRAFYFALDDIDQAYRLGAISALERHTYTFHLSRLNRARRAAFDPCSTPQEKTPC